MTYRCMQMFFLFVLFMIHRTPTRQYDPGHVLTSRPGFSSFFTLRTGRVSSYKKKWKKKRSRGAALYLVAIA